MHKQHRRTRIFALLLGATALLLAGWASADPPTRVARLGYISGAVSFSPAGENDWVQATVNRPLITGDRLWVDAGARAELQVGSRRDPHERQHQRDAAQSRRPRRAAAVGARHAEHSRAAPRRERGVRDRHAESRVFDPPARRIPDRRRSGRQYHDRRGAHRPGRGVWRRRGVRRQCAAGVPFLRDRLARLRVHRGAAGRRVRPLVVRSRSPREIGFRALRLARCDRLRGPGRLRHLAPRRGLRQRVGTDSRCGRLGALPRRTLGVGRPVGLDLG